MLDIEHPENDNEELSVSVATKYLMPFEGRGFQNTSMNYWGWCNYTLTKVIKKYKWVVTPPSEKILSFDSMSRVCVNVIILRTGVNNSPKNLKFFPHGQKLFPNQNANFD